MKTQLPISLACLFVLSACSNPQPPPTDQQSAAALQQEATEPAQTNEADLWNHSQSPYPGTSLTITPNPVDFCTEKLAVVEVSWDLSAAAPKNPELWVGDSKSTKVWAAFKAPTGSRITGKWARPGMRVFAIDATTKTVLNSAAVDAADCDQET